MSDDKGKRFGGFRRTERNGFKNARILPPKIEEEQKVIYKREANEIIKKFLNSGQQHTTLDTMNREQRKVMHEVAQYSGLITRSTGKEPNRYIILSIREKKLTRSSLIATDPITPSHEALLPLTNFVLENPITEEEMTQFMSEKSSKKHKGKTSYSKNKTGVPPKSCCSADLQKAKENLPAFKYKGRVLESIESNDVVIISGGTGCGKTTQVPQFILDDAHLKQKHVRIMVTQPRRIAATSIAERVAKERGEHLGGTVGYQIRLESRKSDKTLLTYCTTGVLLRMLTTDPRASGLTHIIMDEIHEREINTDYLLIALRECLKHRPDLKVILMSATIEGNMQLFQTYFDKKSVEVIRIESRTFDVKVFYLDQILALSGYQPPDTKVFFSSFNFKPEEWEVELKEIQERENNLKRQSSVDALSKMQISDSTITPNTSMYENGYSLANCQCNFLPFYDPMQNNAQFDITNGGSTLENGWQYGPYQTSDGSHIDERTMRQFLNSTGASDIRPAITVEFQPNSLDSVIVSGVRYKLDPNQSVKILEQQKVERQQMPDWPIIYHCDTQPSTVTQIGMAPSHVLHRATVPLTSALGPTKVSDYVSTLPVASSGLSGFSTVDFGGFGEKQRLATLLESEFRSELQNTFPNRTVYYHPKMNNTVDETDFGKLRFGEKYDMFYGSEFENSVDLHLLNHVIRYLADSPVFGTILVFLPGFEDINLVMKMIEKWQNNLTNMKHVTKIPLHSQIHSINHVDIFKPVNADTRKIILATNIAEASITIEDVIFVVDTGKVKQFSYNHEAKLNILSVNSIAKSNAEQRSGRAGRVTNGYCFRLYSEEKYNSMPETQEAEMKRSAIYEVTLHAKSFAPESMRIADFLALAPEPPEQESIAQSIDFLEQLGAFYTPSRNTNEEEDGEQENGQAVDPELTDLGILMAKLPLDPQLSRMLLFGLALKCLTPIVNLVALLSSRDPYLLAQSDERDKQWSRKYEMAGQDYSDHLMFIRLCSEFCSKNGTNQQYEFCRENYLNAATMKMISGTRRQLLQELARAKLIHVQDKDIMTALNDPAFNRHSNSWAMVQGAIAAGCYPSIGVSSGDSFLKKVQTFNDKAAALHPSSILRKQVAKLNKLTSDAPRLEYVAFQEMAQMTSDKSLAMKIVTAIPALTALLFTGPIRMKQDIVEEYRLIYKEGEIMEPEEKVSRFGSAFSYLNLDEWYGVKADKNNLRRFLRLRHKFMCFLLNGVEESSLFGRETTESQNKMLEIIRNLLEEEHIRYNFSPVDMPMPNSTSRSLSNYKYGDPKKSNFHQSNQNFRSASQSFTSARRGSMSSRNFSSFCAPPRNERDDITYYGSTSKQNNYPTNRNQSFETYAPRQKHLSSGYQRYHNGNRHEYYDSQGPANQQNDQLSNFNQEQSTSFGGIGQRGRSKGMSNNRGRGGISNYTN